MILIFVKIIFLTAMKHQTLLILLTVILITACNTKSTNQDISPNIETAIEVDNHQPLIKTDMAESDIQPERDEYITVVLEKLNINDEDCYSEFITEKVLPYDTDKSLVVIPRMSHKEVDLYTLDAYIVIIDHKTHEIIHMYHKKDEWTSDAIQLTGNRYCTLYFKCFDTCIRDQDKLFG